MIRPATESDASAMLVLDELLFGADAWSAASVDAELTAPDRYCVVAESDDGSVGYAITSRAGAVVDLVRIAVHPGMQRRGVARSLLGAVLERARDDGAERMLLEVSAANAVAIAFYGAVGFTEIDRRRRYYRDGSDALVMCLRLGGDFADGRG